MEAIRKIEEFSCKADTALHVNVGKGRHDIGKRATGRDYSKRDGKRRGGRIRDETTRVGCSQRCNECSCLLKHLFVHASLSSPSLLLSLYSRGTWSSFTRYIYSL